MHNFKFVDNRFTFYMISGILILISFAFLFTKGLNYGIDFKGGNILHLTFLKATNETEIRNVFQAIDKKSKLYFSVDQVIIQNVNNKVKDTEYIIQYPTNIKDSLEANKIQELIMVELNNALPYDKNTLEVSSIGPTVGEEMKRDGVIAAILSCLGILLYLAYRFDLQSSCGVLIAVIHDLIIVLGFISIMGDKIEFDTTILAAILTLLGYSVNDSIVIFDRIRENTRISKNGTPHTTIVDNSINQSLSRTMNTTITTLLALIALALYGGNSIFGFSVALTFGCLVGTYSSNCIASLCVIDIFKIKGAKGDNTSALVPTSSN